MKITRKTITASTEVIKTSAVSFDFIHDGNYDDRALESALFDAMEKADVTPIGIDFREVDYSNSPEFRDEIITQGGIDFEWTDTGMPNEAGYIADDIEAYLAEALEQFGYELIGTDFYSVE